MSDWQPTVVGTAVGAIEAEETANAGILPVGAKSSRLRRGKQSCSTIAAVGPSNDAHDLAERMVECICAPWVNGCPELPSRTSITKKA